MTQDPARTATAAPRFATLVAMTALATLSLNMILPSLPAIAADLEVPYATVSLMIGGYLGMTALVQIVAGPLSDRIGRRPVVLTALGIFTLASLICLMARDVHLLLAARFAQAAVIACSAMSLAILRDTNTAEAAATRMATLAMAMAVAPMLGPVLGGGLEQVVGWRAGFAAYSAAGLALVLWALRDLGETAPLRSDAKAGFGAMARDVATLIRLPRFRAYALCLMVSIGAFFTFLAGAPMVATHVFGLSPAAMGVVLGSITGGFFLGSAISSRISERAGLIRMILAGRLVACAGLSAGLAVTLVAGPGLVSTFGAVISVGLGNGLSTPSLNAGMLSLRPELAGNAAGLSGALVVASGAVLSTVAGNVMTPEGAAVQLLVLLLLACLIGLGAALWLWHDARHAARR